jgi:cytochrome oxidase Cu insertion factor (SCO1/SenC/PrrC family)
MRRFSKALVTVLVFGCGACSPSLASPSTISPAPEPGRDVGTELDAALPGAILDLPFTTSDGREVRLRDFAGKEIAISDVMTLCQETCPIDTATFVQTDQAERAAGRSSDEVFLSITVDPARDTPAQLTAYRQLFGSPPNWLTLTGSATSVDALWNYLGVWRQRVGQAGGPPPRNWRTGKPLTYDIEHSDEVFFLDKRQHERFILEGVPYATAGSVPRTLRSYLDDAGKKTLVHPPSTAWTEAQASAVLAWLRSLGR